MLKFIPLCAVVCGVAGLVACASALPITPAATLVPTRIQIQAQVKPTATIESKLTPTSYQWRIPTSWPMPKVPEDNFMSEAKFELGRYLFYDVRLSGNGTQSCSSCHIQALAFSDGSKLSVGSTGDTHPRNAQALVNVAYNATLTWGNPTLDEIEKQVQIPMFGENPIELGIVGNEEEVLSRLREDPRYLPLFQAAFPEEADPINFKTIVYALSSFTRGLISANSPYDRFIGGDSAAMSAEAQRGAALFLSERLECNHCHTGFNLSASTVQANSTFVEQPFFNTGLYNLDGEGAYPPNNVGVMEITNDPSDMGRFRPPTLRNIALTAPYMHDGSLKTLEDVIAFYGRGGQLVSTGPFRGDGRLSPLKSGLVPGFQITDQERKDLIAFLNALTDESFINNARFSNPFVTNP